MSSTSSDGDQSFTTANNHSPTQVPSPSPPDPTVSEAARQAMNPRYDEHGVMRNPVDNSDLDWLARWDAEERAARAARREGRVHRQAREAELRRNNAQIQAMSSAIAGPSQPSPPTPTRRLSSILSRRGRPSDAEYPSDSEDDALMDILMGPSGENLGNAMDHTGELSRRAREYRDAQERYNELLALNNAALANTNERVREDREQRQARTATAETPRAFLSQDPRPREAAQRSSAPAPYLNAFNVYQRRPRPTAPSFPEPQWEPYPPHRDLPALQPTNNPSAAEASSSDLPIQSTLSATDGSPADVLRSLLGQISALTTPVSAARLPPPSAGSGEALRTLVNVNEGVPGAIDVHAASPSAAAFDRAARDVLDTLSERGDRLSDEEIAGRVRRYRVLLAAADSRHRQEASRQRPTSASLPEFPVPSMHSTPASSGRDTLTHRAPFRYPSEEEVAATRAPAPAIATPRVPTTALTETAREENRVAQEANINRTVQRSHVITHSSPRHTSNANQTRDSWIANQARYSGDQMARLADAQRRDAEFEELMRRTNEIAAVNERRRERLWGPHGILAGRQGGLADMPPERRAEFEGLLSAENRENASSDLDQLMADRHRPPASPVQMPSSTIPPSFRPYMFEAALPRTRMTEEELREAATRRRAARRGPEPWIRHDWDLELPPIGDRPPSPVHTVRSSSTAMTADEDLSPSERLYRDSSRYRSFVRSARRPARMGGSNSLVNENNDSWYQSTATSRRMDPDWSDEEAILDEERPSLFESASRHPAIDLFRRHRNDEGRSPMRPRSEVDTTSPAWTTPYQFVPAPSGPRRATAERITADTARAERIAAAGRRVRAFMDPPMTGEDYVPLRRVRLMETLTGSETRRSMYRQPRRPSDYMRDEDWDQSYETLIRLSSIGVRATPAHVISTLETGTHAQWANADSDDRCPVCLDDYKSVDTLMKLPCGHWLHKTCLEEWLQGASTCPVCRASTSGGPVAGPSNLRRESGGSGASGSGAGAGTGPGGFLRSVASTLPGFGY